MSPAPSRLATHARRSTDAERGSLLIVAMMLTAIIGISLASYIRLGRTSLTISNRALYSNAAMNLAENGLEEAMYSVNRMVEDPAYSWDGWTVAGLSGNARRKWTGTTFDQNATGEVRVFVYDYAGVAGPRLLARSLVTLGGGAGAGAPIEKWIEVQLRKTSKFANGLVAKDSIRFSGNNASVDSWNSDPDNLPGTAAIPYSVGVRNDSGSIGSISVSVDAVLVNNADIWGYAATGGAAPAVGAQGLIGPFGTAAGTVNPSHVSTDFSAGFESVAQPTGGTAIGAIGGATTLPAVAGTTATYSLPSISLSGGPGNTLVIQGDVTLYLTNGAGSDAIEVEGNGGIEILPGAALKIYTAGDVDIGGNGVMNGTTSAATANQPINFQIWGTSTDTVSDQSIAIAGNGVLSGIIYAPNGDVRINGNGDVLGSVVAEHITLVGNATFHYDESLANFGGGNPFRVTRWNELTTAADRAAVSGVLSF